MKWIVCISLILLAGLACAQPFVISNPQTDATRFRIRLSSDDGVTWSEWVEGDPVSNGARFDIRDTPRGIYKGELQAGAYTSLTDDTTNVTTSVWEWSSSAPFTLNRRGSNQPVIIRVQP